VDGFLKGFRVDVAWSHITVTDVIQADDPQEILSRPLAQQAGNVVRNAPSAEDILNGEPGSIILINSQLRNLSSRTVDTVDLEVGYDWETEKCGIFSFGVLGSYLMNWYEVYDDKADPSTGLNWHNQYAGDLALPKVRGSASCFWTGPKDSWTEKLSFGPTVNYISAYHDQFYVRRVREFITVDLNATYQAPYDFTITVGVGNIADAETPFHNQSEGYDTQTHDNLGRTWYARVTKVF
jgi:outer membrane receptor protein involved in Fe transport